MAGLLYSGAVSGRLVRMQSSRRSAAVIIVEVWPPTGGLSSDPQNFA